MVHFSVRGGVSVGFSLWVSAGGVAFWSCRSNLVSGCSAPLVAGKLKRRFFMRIFVALDIDDAIRQRIQRFIEGVSGFAPDARWVRPESLHVTLKFVGEKPPEAVEQIQRALSSLRLCPVEMSFRGYGFFPTAKAARVFWVGIECGSPLAEVAKAIDQSLKALGIPQEEHAFTPHLTLARGGGRSGAPHRKKDDAATRNFHRLQEKLAALPTPDFGTMAAHEFFLYQSQLSQGGSRYTKIASFTLM